MKPANVLTVKEAIDLINSDTPQYPVVDNKQLIKRSEYILTNWRGSGMNYTIFLVKRNEQGQIVPNGTKFVAITSYREQQDLLNAITDHYKDRSGKEVDPEKLGLSQISTSIDSEISGSGDGRARRVASTLKYGDRLDSGSKTVEKY